MNKTKYYLITCINYQGDKINLAISRDKGKAKQICKEYTDRQARYKEIPDYTALSLLMSNYAIIQAF